MSKLSAVKLSGNSPNPNVLASIRTRSGFCRNRFLMISGLAHTAGGRVGRGAVIRMKLLINTKRKKILMMVVKFNIKSNRIMDYYESMFQPEAADGVEGLDCELAVAIWAPIRADITIIPAVSISLAFVFPPFP